MPVDSAGRPDRVRLGLSYKYQRLRERLRNAILTGELHGKLPGERMLARRYSANAKTINKALNDLAMESLVYRHVGRGTFVSKGTDNQAPVSDQMRRFGMIWSSECSPATGTVSAALLKARLFEQGHLLNSLEAAVSAGEFAENAVNPGQLRDLDAVAIYAARPSRELLADLRRRHLPVVALNNAHEQLRVSSVLPDYAYGVYRLTEHLLQLGHGSVRLLVDPLFLPAASTAEGGYRAAMQRYGSEPQPMMAVTQSFAWMSFLKGPNRPGAVVAVGSNVCRMGREQALAAGLGAPDQLSFACLPEPGDGRPAAESVTAYETDLEQFIRSAAELLISADSDRVPANVIVPGRLTCRSSTAAPRAPGPLCNPTGVTQV